MHELGVLRQVTRTVNRIAQENRIPQVKHIALDVGQTSGIVPQYLMKLFPVARDEYDVLHTAELKLCTVPGSDLQIKEIGY